MFQENDLIILGLIPWVLFLFVCFFISARNEDSYEGLKKIFIFVLVFSAIRYGIGYDYYSYLYLIEGKAQDYQYSRIEPLSLFLIQFCGRYHYQIFFAIGSFISIYPIYWVCKRISIDPVLSFLIFVLNPLFYLAGLGTVRNAMAYAIAYLIFYLIVNNKWIYSVALLFIAVGIHASSVCVVLAFILWLISPGKKINTIVYVISFFVGSLVVPFISASFEGTFLIDRFNRFANLEESSSGGGLLHIIVNLIALINLYYWDDIECDSKEYRFYLCLYNIGICIWNIFLPIDSTLANRLSNFFFLSQLLIIPRYLDLVAFIRITRTRIYTFFILLFISSFVLSLYGYYTKGNHMSNIPYQVFFFHDDWNNYTIH